MGRSGAWSKASTFSAVLKEEDLKRLCSPSSYRWGDIWEREDHVTEAVVGAEQLRGAVLGAWRRIDEVTVSAPGGQVRSSCTCHEGSLCRHAAALLLHWVRRPKSFVHLEPGVLAGDLYLDEIDDMEYLDESDDDVPAVMEIPALTQELAQMLNADTMPHLRDMARNRGLRVTARNKAELVEQLAISLGNPDSVDAALGELNDQERLTLELIALLRTGASATSYSVGKAYQALGGTGTLQAGVPVAVFRLVDLGLAFPGDRYSAPSPSYSVPQAVVVRLATPGSGPGPIGRILKATTAVSADKDAAFGAAHHRPHVEGGAGLGMLELFQVIVYELHHGRVGREVTYPSRSEMSGVPSGWSRDTKQAAGGMGSGKKAYAQQYVRLVPLPAILSAQELTHLSKLTGRPAPVIKFSLVLMRALGILDLEFRQSAYAFLLDERRLQELLALPPVDASRMLVNAWLMADASLEVSAVVNQGGPLQFHYLFNPYYYQGAAFRQPAGEAVRRVLARVLGRLAADAASREGWYAFDDLLELLWTVCPSLLSPPSSAQHEWRFSSSSRPDVVLNLDRRADWEQLWRPLVERAFSGPMSWLQVVDVARPRGKPTGFRPRPLAASIAGQPVGDHEVAPARGAFEVDLRQDLPVVLVRPGTGHTVIYSMLSSLGEMLDPSTRGLRFQLRPERVQAVFDAGMTGPQLTEQLALQGDSELADQLGPVIEEWWTRYGTVRLYDDVTLVELGDDLLLRELLASGRLQDALVHTFSPRLVAVRPAQVDSLLADLTRLGYTPRVVGDA